MTPSPNRNDRKATPSPASGQRVYAIDALRVFAMISVVFLHASISYMPTRLPDLLWAARDPSATGFFDWLFFWVRGLTMRIFFLVAGFFTVKLYEDLGPRAFLENRFRRIVIPFAVACGVLIPLLYLVWSYGWIRTGCCDLSQFLRMRYDEPIQRNLYGPAHLWFLEFLILFYAAYCVYRRLRPEAAKPGYFMEKILFSDFRPLFLAVPSILILCFDVDVVINFRNTFVPHPLKVLYYGFFFLAGVCLYPFRDRLKTFASGASAYLVLSIPVFAEMVALSRKHAALPLQGFEYFRLVASTSLFVWLSVFAVFGYFTRFLNRRNPLVSVLSGASYWIYLCHLPVVGLAQILFLPFDLPAAVKFTAVVVTALGFGLLTYEIIVRRTRIGLCLNGPAQFAGSVPEPFSFRKKTLLSLLVLVAVALSGISFQRTYHNEKKRYEEIIAGFYRKYFDREPDAVGLRHWTNWALNRWGLEKVERVGFMEASQRQRQGAV